ncbi:MAG: reprolysin-like metallopeptidase [Bacteroidota bacterium]
MTRFTSVVSLLFCIAWTNLSLQAQSGAFNPWTNIEESQLLTARQERPIVPKEYQTFSLQGEQLDNFLKQAPMRFSDAANRTHHLLKLPMPDGSAQSFRIVKAPVMHPELAAKYPSLSAYAGYGVEDPTAYARFVWTPAGFRAVILSGQSPTILIDPYAKGDNRHHMSYFKKNYEREQARKFHCAFESNGTEIDPHRGRAERRAGDCNFRTYRLALSCTGEYGQFHGGTKDLVMQALVTTMARVNGVFERDLGLTTIMVPNNDTLIFLNGSTDPYSNSQFFAMMGQNQTTVDARIGNANYDIGHVFSTFDGGVASRAGNVCFSSEKARGVTGQPVPVNDGFDIDYVAHEMGHQLGGTHTQNNNCQRTVATAVEPGSASTIMGYAGICNPNVQTGSDDYYHAANLAQIARYTNQQTGSICATVINTNNTPPNVSAGEDYTIPALTPFVLTADGSDDDGDALTYCWEQMDNEPSPMPPEPTSDGGPMFRSLQPVASPSRTFPRLENLVDNASDRWEVLPGVSRAMDFRVTVRDNRMGGGCTSEDDMRVNVTNSAGPFVVLQPNTQLTWLVNDFETVRWDVANTDQAPVSCSEVNILLSTDGGLTYPVTLASNVPNSGSAIITVPNNISEDCRVRVICADNIFFDISNEDFIIAAPQSPGVALLAQPESQSQCGSEPAIYRLRFNSLANFSDQIDLRVEGVPMGATSSFSTNSFVPSQDVDFTVSGLDNVADGQYDLVVYADWQGETQDSFLLSMDLFNVTPSTINLSEPFDGSKELRPGEPLLWEANVLSQSYVVEIANNPTFAAGTLVEVAEVSEPMYTPIRLLPTGVYYWRVRGVNACGEGEGSSVFSFQLFNTECRQFQSGDVPKIISSSSPGIYTSNFNLTQDFNILDLNVQLNVRHRNVGDVIAMLKSPSLDTILLMDRPGVPDSQFGCEEDDIDVVFDDEATLSADELETTCDPFDESAIEGTFQPIEPLSVLRSKAARGLWQLILEDPTEDDGGFVRSWGIEVCFERDLPEATGLLKNFTLLVVNGTMEPISKQFLEGSKSGLVPQNIQYTLLEEPSNGLLMLMNDTLRFGDVFTQQAIDDGSLAYQHDGSDTDSDEFRFDLGDSQGGWLPNNTFSINIIDGTQTEASILQESLIACNGENTASLVVIAAGGTPPYEYSLDGVNFQVDSLFANLGAGMYTLTIRDGNSQTIMRMVDITQPDALDVTTSSLFREVTAIPSGGISPYEYSLNGISYQSDSTFVNVANGDYVLQIRDANGCLDSTQLSINVPNLTASISMVEDATCFDGTDGVVNIEVTDGIPPYEYSLDGTNFTTDNPITGVSAGTYTIRVRDSIDQLIRLSNVTVEQPDQIEFTVEVNLDSVRVLNPMGGTGPLEYSLDGTNFQAEPLFTEVDNGTYTLVVRDANGCTETQEVEVDVMVSVFDPQSNWDIEVLPNPNRGSFRLRMDIQSGRELQVRLFDGLGRLVHREQLEASIGQLDHLLQLEQLPTGLYHLEVTNGQLVGRAKVLLSR